MIEDPIIEYCHNDCSVVSFTVRFRCVCDQYEQFGPVIFKSVLIDVFWPDGRIDFAQMLEESGAVSVEHLLKDGYSDIEISRIRGAYA